MTDLAIVSDAEDAPIDHDAPLSLPRYAEDVCHDVNSALAIIVLCVELLGERAGSEDKPAVADAQLAVRRIADDMANLRERAAYARLASLESGVHKRATPGGLRRCGISDER